MTASPTSGEDPLHRFVMAMVACLLSTWPAAVAAPEDSNETPRRFSDQPETAPGDCFCSHLIYFVALDGIDRSLDVNGAMAASVKSLRSWFAAQMAMAPRVDRVTGTEQFDITFVRGRSAASYYSSFSRLTEELAARSFNDPAKRYVIYAGLDRGSTCGESTFGYPMLPGASYAAVYLDSSGCKGNDLGQGTAATAGTAETILAHEWLHADGFVFPASPRHCPVSLHHVCTAGLYLASTATGLPDPERPDVMFPLTDQKLSQKQLDVGRNDYLDHGLPGLPDLRRSAWLEAA